MKKPIDISQYAEIEVIIHSFKQDCNGNPIAHFIVNAYKWNVQVSPSACLYESKRRKQVSFAGTPKAYAEDALRAAGIDLDCVSFSQSEGSRSGDSISVKYHVVVP